MTGYHVQDIVVLVLFGLSVIEIIIIRSTVYVQLLLLLRLVSVSLRVILYIFLIALWFFNKLFVIARTFKLNPLNVFEFFMSAWRPFTTITWSSLIIGVILTFLVGALNCEDLLLLIICPVRAVLKPSTSLIDVIWIILYQIVSNVAFFLLLVWLAALNRYVAFLSRLILWRWPLLLRLRRLSVVVFCISFC